MVRSIPVLAAGLMCCGLAAAQPKGTAKPVVTKFEKEFDANDMFPPRKAVGTLVDGEPDGEFKYYSGDGKLIAVEPYRKGQRHGVRVTYYPSGKVFSEEDFVDDQIHGEAKKYFPDGTLRSEFTWVRGKHLGKAVLYYPNGKKNIEATLEMGLYQGKRYHYTVDGTLMGVSLWEDGKEVDRQILIEGRQRDLDAAKEMNKFPNVLKAVWPEAKR